MKTSLQSHIEAIFSTLQIENLPYEVYECKVDTLPEWTNHVGLAYEFLICCEQNQYIDKLKKFLGKEIYQFEDKVYWFEGDKIIELSQTEIIHLENTEETTIDYLKTETRLPAWLDKLIFNQLNAEYAPDFQRFEYNLDLTEEENLKYLGTYFPRSYAESFCIFDNIFQNIEYLQAIAKKQTLNILSVGCGTGGDLIGLLTIIEKYSNENKTIKIWAIDGNKKALNLLEKIINHHKVRINKTIELQIVNQSIDSFTKLNLTVLGIHDVCFDFILCFKMVCEIISRGTENSYYDFVKKFLPLLSETGLCLLLDVTVQTKNGIYLPILMNRQVNQVLRELKDYQTLLPLPCRKFENICNEPCFTQKHFFVTHKQKAKDLSKVSYRVIGKNKFSNLLIGNKLQQKYILQKGDKTTFCPKSESDIIVDAYKLKR
jgi:SAM-dependent methyltransferase